MGTGSNSESNAMLFAIRELVDELNRSTAGVEVKPFKFVSVFRSTFPMFAQQAEGGQGFLQQDAEECWSTLVTLLSQRLQLPAGVEPSDLGAPQAAAVSGTSSLRRNLGDMLFGIEMKCVFRCLETDAEPPYTACESVRKISCHINDKTAHLYTAVELSLTETIEKSSEVLGREAQYKKEARLARLPPYLPVQFVRFAWRKDTNKRSALSSAHHATSTTRHSASTFTHTHTLQPHLPSLYHPSPPAGPRFCGRSLFRTYLMFAICARQSCRLSWSSITTASKLQKRPPGGQLTACRLVLNIQSRHKQGCSRLTARCR